MESKKHCRTCNRDRDPLAFRVFRDGRWLETAECYSCIRDANVRNAAERKRRERGLFKRDSR